MILERGGSKPILWEEFGKNRKINRIYEMVIILIGACEQHVPHLPLTVDTIDCLK